MESSTVRSFSGCWTCRLRRKKCDENRPSCDVCSALMITCHFNTAKPEWMDGGPQQGAMAEALKIEVKHSAQRRRTVPSLGGGQRVPLAKPVNAGYIVAPLQTPASLVPPTSTSLSGGSASNVRSNGLECTLAGMELKERITIGRSDACLVMFYLENLFPFLFPFYRPALLQGGRTWILEMMISSPVVKQALLCQSSYFLSLAKGRTNWDTILEQTRDAFEVLRRSLQIIGDAGVTEHLHGAVRILASVIQVQRFEIAILSFNNCQAHLNAAVALFTQLLESVDRIHHVCPSTNFNAVLDALNPVAGSGSTELFQAPIAEQAAFRFSSALLILDDIIAATILREEPRLYSFHRSLLYTPSSSETVINIEEVVGCQNWALFYISEIATLDGWKQRSHLANSLDVMELAQRASTIKHHIEEHLLELETVPVNDIPRPACLLDLISSDFGQQARAPVGPTSLATRIWAHAALIYLFVVVSGWQPANSNVRYHTGKVIELLSQPTMPPALLRSMVWPFCVAGCLAAPEQEAQFREMVQILQPSTVFGTVHKALEIMEYAWMNRSGSDLVHLDLATCFRSQGDLVLLV